MLLLLVVTEINKKENRLEIVITIRVSNDRECKKLEIMFKQRCEKYAENNKEKLKHTSTVMSQSFDEAYTVVTTIAYGFVAAEEVVVGYLEDSCI